MTTLRGMMTLLLVVLIGLISLMKLQVAAIDQPKPGCNNTCGNLTIPFPFGTSPDCYLDDTFLITCNDTHYPPQPFLRESNIEVLNITLDGEMKVSSWVAYGCYNETGASVNDSNSELTLRTFSVSSMRNKFTVVGCDNYAYVQDLNRTNYSVGCISLCNQRESVENGSCSGIGCCQASIPKGVRDFVVTAHSFHNQTKVHEFNPCAYAFVSEVGYFNFSSLDLLNLKNRSRVPTVLDYAVGKSSCREAKKNNSSYACRSLNSYCKDSVNGQGYICNCSAGYGGNPYLIDGCADIDECKVLNPCKGNCTNYEGHYNCSCPKGFEGDGKLEDCRKTFLPEGNTLLYVALGVVSSLLLLLVGSSWMCYIARERKLLKTRKKFFLENGGLVLLDKLSKQTGSTNRAIIFTEEDLRKATDNFSEATVIGKGGFGTVHKGVLSDNRIVAIKKSKVTDQSQNEQFINEVIILSEINHRNVVKLLGCCLETEVPLLVYEFISNGTLYSHIHDEFLPSNFTWNTRLKVAAETADALAYLHAAASVPIIHRDVKSVNILLTESYIAKVADFGASRFIPLDKTQLTTLVQGTLGYLDPEYFHSSQLTDKSDVYSFGVVLAELLTGEEAISFHKSEKQRNLATYFVSSILDNKLLEILDHRLGVERNFEQVKDVAMLAKQCLNVKADERPTMKEVARELEGLRLMLQHPWIANDLNPEESEYLLNPNAASSSYSGLVGSSGCNTTTAYDSMNDQSGSPENSPQLAEELEEDNPSISVTMVFITAPLGGGKLAFFPPVPAADFPCPFGPLLGGFRGGFWLLAPPLLVSLIFTLMIDQSVLPKRLL
ncbi:hypothetical protein ACH5RR_034155 [Cinchona calisaya]|uniref:Uncharacterized protein n=1 Tax=Cinchona calisaya TaxID=153742 RepID=A0ABD2YA24_9GENT